MSEEMNKKVEIVRSFFKKEQPKNHPIKDHPLEKCEEYTKNLYVDMLCVFAMYDNDDTENQFNFIQRIMSGIEDTLSINDHIKRAMEVNVDKVGEFIKQIQSNDIKDIFFIDALIISCANGSPTKKQTEFLAEFADMLGLTKDDIQFLCEFVIGIFEQNLDKLTEFVNNHKEMEHYVKKSLCYIQSLIDSRNFSTDSKIYCYSLIKSKIEMFNKSYQFKNNNSVTLENIVIDNNLVFNSVETVNLKSCVFENIKKVALDFSGVRKVNIENCIFKNLEKVLYFKNDGINIKISNSSFKDCRGDYRTPVIISSDKKIFCDFENCNFQNIIAQYSDGYVIAGGSEIYIKAKNCQFYNCVGGYCLFYRGLYEPYNFQYEDCEYIGCVKTTDR